jgi:hypothetical protein
MADFAGRLVPAGTLPSVGLYQLAGDQPSALPSVLQLLLLGQ